MHLSPSTSTPLVSALVLLMSTASALFAAELPLPDPSSYITVEDGHLSADGQRQRFWAVIGKPFLTARTNKDDTPAQQQEAIALAKRGSEILLDRLDDLGFNACRLREAVPNTDDYVIGDGSPADATDAFIAGAKARGWRLWAFSLNRVGNATPADVSIIEEPATAAAWQKAVGSAKPFGLRNHPARIWDPRLEALAIERMRLIATHFNKYTGLRWCDDPVFAVWELSNEEWWIRRMLSGKWQTLPAYFRNQLIARWNQWLADRYVDESALAKAWNGLLPGESLTDGTILFAPMTGSTTTAAALNDANAVAAEALQSAQQTYQRSDFSEQRARDVLAFLIELQHSHKAREAAALKSWGRSTQLSPLLYDTGIGYEIQSAYLHQQARVVSHDAYVNGWGPQPDSQTVDTQATAQQQAVQTLVNERISANDGPWINWLLKPPGICQGVPWLEHNRVTGLPFLVYETQIQQPAKYRADFPLRLAALGSIQDWDWVGWHYFSPGDDIASSPRPFDRALDVTAGAHPQGYHFTYDEVQTAMMRAAGHLFRAQALDRAPSPTQFIYGSKSLTDPASMDHHGSYGMSGLDMLQTVYQYGVRIAIDPSREDDQVIGPVVPYSERKTHNPYAPTPQISFDWKKGNLIIDAPGAVAFTGLIDRYGSEVHFQQGIILRDVSLINPPGSFSPIDEKDRYLAFSLYTKDGQPLATTRSAAMSLVSTSFNTGFSLGTGIAEPAFKIPPGTKAGRLPVLVSRVGATVHAPELAGMTWHFRDWNLDTIASGVIAADGILVIPADKPVFVVDLER